MAWSPTTAVVSSGLKKLSPTAIPMLAAEAVRSVRAIAARRSAMAIAMLRPPSTRLLDTVCISSSSPDFGKRLLRGRLGTIYVGCKGNGWQGNDVPADCNDLASIGRGDIPRRSLLSIGQVANRDGDLLGAPLHTT